MILLRSAERNKTVFNRYDIHGNSGLLLWFPQSQVPCSCCGKRKPVGLLSSASWSCGPGNECGKERMFVFAFSLPARIRLAHIWLQVFRLYLIIADAIPEASLIRRCLQIFNPKLQDKAGALYLSSFFLNRFLTGPSLLRTLTSMPFSRRLSGSDFISQRQYCWGIDDLVLSWFPATFLFLIAVCFTEESSSPSATSPILWARLNMNLWISHLSW